MYPEEMFVKSVETETFFEAQIMALVCRRNHDDNLQPVRRREDETASFVFRVTLQRNNPPDEKKMNVRVNGKGSRQNKKALKMVIAVNR